MWERIAAARAEARASEGTIAPATAPAIAPDTRVISIDAARARRRPVRTWAILAGTLAAGIALGILGRDLWRTDAGPRTTLAVADDSTRDSLRRETRRDTGVRIVEQDATPPMGGPYKPPPGPIAPQRQQFAQDAGAPPKNNSPRDRGTNTTPRTRDESPTRSQYRDRGNAIYAAAAVQTLSQAEALLVAWRVDAPRDTATARQLGRWARDVLGSTRLLLDSPAASDPRLRELLDDLELVLAQIVQLSGAPLTAEERALLEGSVKARDLLPRIRSAVPAGLAGSSST
jgi:hypothetical protein